MDKESRLWTSLEVLQVLIGLMKAYDATPWLFRFLMRPWHDALIAAGIALAGEEAVEQSFYERMEQNLLEDYE